jgi:hypothetical protein
MFDMNDPNTFWLNVTNIGLGLITLVCVAVVGYGVVQEVLVRIRKTRTVFAEDDDHAFAVSGLGLTMADGGERIDKKPVSEQAIARTPQRKQKKQSKK